MLNDFIKTFPRFLGLNGLRPKLPDWLPCNLLRVGCVENGTGIWILLENRIVAGLCFLIIVRLLPRHIHVHLSNLALMVEPNLLNILAMCWNRPHYSEPDVLPLFEHLLLRLLLLGKWFGLVFSLFHFWFFLDDESDFGGSCRFQFEYPNSKKNSIIPS